MSGAIRITPNRLRVLRNLTDGRPWCNRVPVYGPAEDALLQGLARDGLITNPRRSPRITDAGRAVVESER